MMAAAAAAAGADGTGARLLLGDGMLPGRSLLDAAAASAADRTVGPGWAPFNGPDGQALLGSVDLAFLGTYAIGWVYALEHNTP